MFRPRAPLPDWPDLRHSAPTPAGKAAAGPAGTILTFTGDGAAAAELVETFDFRRGGRIDLEFQDDARQTNRFPRLLDSPAVSLYFEAEPNDRGDKNLKALISDAGIPTDAYDQIVIRSPHRPEFWHTLSLVIDPEAKFFCLQLDDGERLFAPLTGTARPQVSQIRPVSELSGWFHPSDDGACGANYLRRTPADGINMII